jgi:hypothetical protein
MTKRVLKQIRLDKIAAVDRPCQEHAVVSILKRAPEKEGNMSKFSRLTNTELEKRIDQMILEIDKRTQHFAFSHDDGTGDGGNYNYEDGVSNPSMGADDGDGSSDYEDPTDEEDDQIGKSTIDAAQLRNDETNRPGALQHSNHPNGPHKFEALVTHVQNTEGIPKSQAMALARTRYPDIYRSYLEGTNGNSVNKRGPTSYEDLVATEIRKGFSHEIASQRVAQQYGFRGFDHSASFAKAENVSDAFHGTAQDIYLDEGCSRVEALRKARKLNPAMFKALQRA